MRGSDYDSYLEFVQRSHKSRRPACQSSLLLALELSHPWAAIHISQRVAQGLMQNPIVIVAIKPSREAKLGLGLNGNGTVRITSIADDGLFAKTDLSVGMILKTVNGMNCATAAKAVAALKAAERQVTIVAVEREYSPAPDSPEDIESSSSADAVIVVINRPRKKSKLGIDLDFGAGGKMKVTSIHPKGPFAETRLKVGMRIDSVNGVEYSTYNDGIALLNRARGQVTIAASHFDKVSPRKADSTAAYYVLGEVACSGISGIDCCMVS